MNNILNLTNEDIKIVIECNDIINKNLILHSNNNLKLIKTSGRNKFMTDGNFNMFYVKHKHNEYVSPLKDKICITDDIELVDNIQVFSKKGFLNKIRDIQELDELHSFLRI